MIILKAICRYLFNGVLLGVLSVLCINLFVIWSASQATRQVDAIKPDSQIPVLVFGAGVIDNERPSEVLKARLDKAYELYEQDPDQKFIMSGDHMEDNYNEVRVMKTYLVHKGIPSEQIYLDHAGYSTYESLFRLKNVLHIDRAVLITQAYHLPRALMVARHVGLEAVGCPAEETPSTRFQRERREVLARLKDFAVVYLKYPQEVLEEGYAFNMSQSGDLTNDKDALVCK